LTERNYYKENKQLKPIKMAYYRSVEP